METLSSVSIKSLGIGCWPLDWKRSLCRGRNFKQISVVANLDLREDVCYGSVTSSGCDKPYGGRYKKVDCCCSVVGGGWGNPCQECPLENTGNTNRKFQSVLSHSFPSNFSLSLRAGSRLAPLNQTPTRRNELLTDSLFADRACDSKERLPADYNNLQFVMFCLNYPTLKSLSAPSGER